MIGMTVGRYFGKRILKAIAIAFGIVTLLVFLFDFVEQFRRFADRPDVSALTVVGMSMLRVPSFCEQMLPFAVLFGAIASFLTLSRHSELVVVRSAGLSVWQIILPAVTVGAVLGLVATGIYNPIAAIMRDHADEMALSYASTTTSKAARDAAQAAWLRQGSADGEAIIRAEERADRGLSMGGVTVLMFDRKGEFQGRITARTARFEPGKWVLSDGVLHRLDGGSESFKTRDLATHLNAEQIRDALASPETVPFWQLPGVIETAHRSGVPAFRYQLQYQVLLARPVFLVAMVGVAALVSLRAFRFGNIGKMILSGVVAGFVLYVVAEIARNTGGAGLVSPVVAAWVPGLLALLTGYTILLYQEDG